ncbi:hypothetical protein ACFWPQ_36650 [Streptomyces sp. NPDC058464]|uniref:hypothetical protein n=1 Tax=Streptomyces sp. NPDC058464 TaxID=3346511 RepID=UPI00365EA602
MADGLALAAGLHPEIVALSGLLASDHWERTALRDGGLAPFVGGVSSRGIGGVSSRGIGVGPDDIDAPSSSGSATASPTTNSPSTTPDGTRSR